MNQENQKINIQASEACFSIECADREVLEWIKSTYSAFLVNDPADVFVRLDIVTTLGPDEFERRARQGKYIYRDGAINLHSLVWGNYDYDSRTIRLQVERQILNPDYVRFYFNQMFSLFYFSCHYIRGVRQLDSHIIHSSSIIIDNQAILFTGPSGIGKTTAAKLCEDAGFPIINDEGNLIIRSEWMSDTYFVRGFPILGKLPGRNSPPLPLLCILFLKQSTVTKIRKIDRISATKRLFYQVSGYYYLGQNDIEEIMSSKIKFGDEITQCIPCYELEFSLNGSEMSKALNELKGGLLKGNM